MTDRDPERIHGRRGLPYSLANVRARKEREAAVPTLPPTYTLIGRWPYVGPETPWWEDPPDQLWEVERDNRCYFRVHTLLAIARAYAREEANA